jgi:hypothetical protein
MNVDLLQLLGRFPQPKQGGEEVRIGGFWAVLADEWPYSDTQSLWKANLMGIQTQVLTPNGPVYAKPVGWSQEHIDEAGRSRVDYIIGVDMVDRDGSTCYWNYQVVPPWEIGPAAEGQERSAPPTS